MLIARVIGTTVSTIKDEKLVARKLLVVRQTDERGEPVGKPYVAIDTVDAGIGDLVLTASGPPPDRLPSPRIHRWMQSSWRSSIHW
jgi:microcompartment protein CcmK/EutM